MIMPSERRKLIITLKEEVDLRFLVEHPCSTDRLGLFGRLERTRFHHLISEVEPLFGKMLTETARFFLDEVALTDAVDDNSTHRILVAKGERLKDKLRRFAIRHYNLDRRA